MSTSGQDKVPAADDPLAARAASVPGDPGLMFDCLVEEYARLGMDEEAICRLLVDPWYQALHGLAQVLGQQAARQRVRAVIARCGVLRVSDRSNPIHEGGRP